MAQSVFVTAHTWDKRSYPLECQKSNLVHSIYLEGDFTVYTFKEGARQMEPISFAAGESKTFIVEFDWGRQHITPDWSVTAWAEDGEVAVTHTNTTLNSDTLPFIARINADGSSTDEGSGNDSGIENLEVPTETLPVEPLQQNLNDFVLSYEIDTVAGFCGFRLREVMDEELGRYKTVAAHNCESYAVNLTLYMLPNDWDMVERTYEVRDANGEIVYANEQVGDCVMQGSYKTCQYYLSPGNPRMGLMMAPESVGLINYAAQWAVL